MGQTPAIQEVVMGERGPVPKRSSQRRRRNKDSEPEQVETVPSGVAEQPPADEDWHPVARAWYEALARSGQSAFYEASDWATAVLVAENMSRELKPQVVGMKTDENGAQTEPAFAIVPMKGAALAAYLKAMTALLVTEGDRRRAGVELQRAGAKPAADEVPNLDDYRRRLAG